MTDIELQPADRFEWERILRRCLIPLELKGLASLMSQYGNADGTEVRPGMPRLVAVCGKPERTLRRMIDEILRLGLMERVTHGGGRTGKAAKYRLTVPSDLLERVPMLEPDETTPANNVREPAGVEPVDNQPAGASQASYSGHDRAETGRSTEGDQAATPATSESYSGQNEGLLRPPSCSTPRRTKDQPTTPTKTSPEVSTSPVDPQPRVAAVDRPGAVPPAARPTGRGVQAGIWPHAVPDAPPDAAPATVSVPRDRQPSREDAAGIAAVRDVLAARRAARRQSAATAATTTAAMETTTCSPPQTSTGSPPPVTPYAPTGTAPTSAPT